MGFKGGKDFARQRVSRGYLKKKKKKLAGAYTTPSTSPGFLAMPRAFPKRAETMPSEGELMVLCLKIQTEGILSHAWSTNFFIDPWWDR